MEGFISDIRLKFVKQCGSYGPSNVHFYAMPMLMLSKLIKVSCLLYLTFNDSAH